MLSPRDVPDRDSFYMGLAFFIAAKSKDPNTQIGALIVDEYNFPLGYGYNGPPRSIPDNEVNWERPFKYDYVRHAEENAIDHSNKPLNNSTIYVTAHPCKRCMLLLATKQIAKVIYLDFKSDSGSSLRNEDMEISKEIAKKAGIKIEKFKGDLKWVQEWTEKLNKMGVFGEFS